MKIAILSRWNTACGVSLLAELVGREWAKEHEIVVFAPNNIRPVGEDEEFVVRCYSDEGDHTKTFFDPEPFLEEDYDIFFAQRLEWTPLKNLLEIFPQIKKKAKTVYVIHERKPPTNPIFYEFEWDAVVCFDERYVRQWKNIPKFGDRIRVIPYPTGPLIRGDKDRARRKLGIDYENVILSYGWAPELHVLPVIPALKEVSEEVEFKFLVLVDPESRVKIPEHGFIEVRRARLPLMDLYEYLHASDICLIHKEKSEVREGEVVVSSSVLMCLGALTPIFTSDTEFVSFLKDEVVKYRDVEELKRKVREFFAGNLDVRRTLLAAEEYVRKNSPEAVAKKYVELFEELLTGN